MDGAAHDVTEALSLAALADLYTKVTEPLRAYDKRLLSMGRMEKLRGGRART